MFSDHQAPGRDIRARNQAAIRVDGEQGRAETRTAAETGITARGLFLERFFHVSTKGLCRWYRFAFCDCPNPHTSFAGVRSSPSHGATTVWKTIDKRLSCVTLFPVCSAGEQEGGNQCLRKSKSL